MKNKATYINIDKNLCFTANNSDCNILWVEYSGLLLNLQLIILSLK